MTALVMLDAEKLKTVLELFGVKIQLFRGRRKEGDVGREEIIPRQTKERMVISHLDLTICANNVVNLDVSGIRVLNIHWVANPFIRGCMSVLKQ
jgi:hypothetical protein